MSLKKQNVVKVKSIKAVRVAAASLLLILTYSDNDFINLIMDDESESDLPHI